MSTLALALSAFLSWHYLKGGAVLGCGAGGGCDQLLSSRWSAIGGVLPVSGLAAGTYLAMMVASFFVGPGTDSAVRRLAWSAMLVLTGAAAGGAVWFIIVQKWLVGSFCPYCMATHITGLLLAILILWQAPRQRDEASAEVTRKNPSPDAVMTLGSPQKLIGRWPAVSFASVGLMLAGIMAICQATIVPPSTYHGGESAEKLPAIDPRSAPLIGSPDAAHVVTVLFDYQCPHCQRLHFMLGEVVRRFGGQLAFMLCPSPLNPNCNPYVALEVEEFKGSCELAKIALTVWVAKREAFPDFELWMFSLESGDRWRPRSLEAAKAKAIELVGQVQFEQAAADPWIDRYVQASVQIYGNTSRDGNTAVPKLVLGSRWVVPRPNDTDDLISILHESFGLPMPESGSPRIETVN